MAEQSGPEGPVTKLDDDPLGRTMAGTRVSRTVPDGAKTAFATTAGTAWSPAPLPGRPGGEVR